MVNYFFGELFGHLKRFLVDINYGLKEKIMIFFVNVDYKKISFFSAMFVNLLKWIKRKG